MADVFIDLDGYAGVPERRAVRGKRRPAPALAIAVALLSAFVLTSSVARPEPAIRLLWSAQVGTGFVDIGTGTVYARAAGADGLLVALDIPTGRIRWRLDLGSRPVSVTENGLGQAVISGGTAPGLGFPRTTSVDVTTGTVLNEQIGLPVGLTAGGRVALVYNDVVAGALSGSLDLIGVRTAGGPPAWRVPLPGASQFWIDRDAAGLARWAFTMVADGTGTVWELATGGRTAEVMLGSPESARVGPPPALGAAVVSGQVVIAERLGTGLAIRGYALPELTPQWAVTLPPLGDGVFVFGSCANLACLRRGGETIVFDPITGRRMFGLDGDVVGRLDGMVTAVRAARGGGETVAFDARTGELLRAYPGWVLTDWPAAHGTPLYRREHNRTTFAELSEAGYVRPLGEVPGGELTCRARGAMLACLEPGGLLRVWKIT